LNEARPDALLKSALEKIVYFEARSEQLQNDLAGARSDVERLKRELADAAQREIELRRELAKLEVTVTRSHRDQQEMGARIDALLQERTALVEKLVDGARIREEGGEGGLDLASFISELRGEVLRAREAAAPALVYVGAPAAVGAVAAASSSSPPATPSPAQLQAVRLRSEGRLQVSEEEVLALSMQGKRGHTEQTLFGFSVRELSAPDGAARIRAAERLRALGDAAAAPALASALHSEREPAVLVTLLSAFAHLAQREGTPIAAAHLTSPSPDVRMAALKAVLQLDPEHGAPHIAAAVGDPDSSVRRRASLLALSLQGEEAQRLSQEMARDKDPEVRRLTALALGASGRAQARGSLLEFLHDEDVKVRRAAAQSLSQLLGQDVSYLVHLDDAPRRREVRRRWASSK
jgi:hypothetical protein